MCIYQFKFPKVLIFLWMPAGNKKLKDILFGFLVLLLSVENCTSIEQKDIEESTYDEVTGEAGKLSMVLQTRPNGNSACFIKNDKYILSLTRLLL